MKYLIIGLMFLIYGCAVDTGTSVTESDIKNLEQETCETPSILYGCSSASIFGPEYVDMMFSSSSKEIEIEKHYFPTDLEYAGIFKHSNGAYLVMKNNTEYEMKINVNYNIFCKVNGKNDYSATKTVNFNLNKYEQKESSTSIDGYWHGGMDSIECKGTITSIVPTAYDKSNFQSWHGNFDISTN